MKLLLAIDALTPSEQLVSAVVSRPWPPFTRVRVVTAIEYAAIPEKIWHDAAGQIEPVRQALVEKAADGTGHATEQLEQSGITAEAVLKIDDPRFVILREAEKWPADLIFIRAHSYANFSRWLLGSVAGAVIRDALCSVEIVRATTETSEYGARNGLKILLGIDGSAFSLLAAESVAARPWPRGTSVKLLSVIERVAQLPDHLLHDSTSEVQHMREVSTQAEAIISRAGLSTTTNVVKGDPREEITNQAEAWGANLVVVGSHGRRGLKRWLLGSVSEAVAKHAPCSVEVIKPSRGSEQ